jgi:hypothetical protein
MQHSRPNTVLCPLNVDTYLSLLCGAQLKFRRDVPGVRRSIRNIILQGYKQVCFVRWWKTKSILLVVLLVEEK